MPWPIVRNDFRIRSGPIAITDWISTGSRPYWFTPANFWDLGGIMHSEAALRSAGTLLSRVQAPASVSRSHGGP
ncbi:hypothetical protein PoB_002800800 [Plakobranchus ocellatus]|uniref:Uncharacterized protein n=1 Tax=Plakobranchus ocellatus TaxID=259542 RepID=A0AAV4A489_9GAST|nr:hypothetical protein PoB_002800800 [Plakobranchus ocellatus]